MANLIDILQSIHEGSLDAQEASEQLLHEVGLSTAVYGYRVLRKGPGVIKKDIRRVKMAGKAAIDGFKAASSRYEKEVEKEITRERKSKKKVSKNDDTDD